MEALLWLGWFVGLFFLIRAVRQSSRVAADLADVRRHLDRAVDRISTLEAQLQNVRKTEPASEAARESAASPAEGRAPVADVTGLVPTTSIEAPRSPEYPPAPSHETAADAARQESTASTESAPVADVPRAADVPRVADVPRAADAPRAAASNPIIQWLTRGNPVAKLGVVLLLFGLGFLLRFASERGLLPIELRLAGSAVIATSLLYVGWRLRRSSPVYALTLQGGAIGALYITLFAAFRLYALLPQTMVFALLLVVCACCVTLAVRQNAQSLAWLASFGGYLAPILLSTGESRHLALFSYYTMLSCGILAISIWRDWRALNLIGFAFTFGVGTLWGLDRYDPAFYTGCQLFLVLNVVIYGILAPLGAVRRAEGRAAAMIDSTLVFGSPIVGFGLQAGLTDQWEFGQAFSALAFGAVYLFLAWFTVRRWPDRARRLTIAFVALGGGFLTLAIPLALSARFTAMSWALEGVGVIWAGRSQENRRLQWSGTGLLMLAAGAAWGAWAEGVDTPTFLLMTGTLSLTWMAGAWFWRHADGRNVMSLVLLTGGVVTAFVLIEGGSDRLMLSNGPAAMLALGWMSATAVAWRVVARRLSWPALNGAAFLLWPVTGLTLVRVMDAASHPLGNGWWGLIWLVGFASAWWLLATDRRSALAWPQGILHATFCWLVFAVVGLEVNYGLNRLGWGHEEWHVGGLLAVCAAAVFVMWRLDRRRFWAIDEHPQAYWGAGVLPALALGGGLLYVGNFFDGAMPGHPYLPLVNPLEQGAAFTLIMAFVWLRALLRITTPDVARLGRPLVFGFVLWWVNGVLLRTIATVAHVAWTSDALWQSAAVQTGMAVAWAVAALACMATGVRRASRAAWITGASLLAVVVVKLFLVDSARTTGLARAIAFIAVALLVLLIGYIAPLPPRPSREDH